MDLSNYRLTDWAWVSRYIALLGKEQYMRYTDHVYEALNRLPKGSFLDITKNVKTENVELFIKICCLFIQSHPTYEMSDDYTKIRHREYVSEIVKQLNS